MCSSASRGSRESWSGAFRPAARSRRKVAPELVERLCLDDDQLDELSRLAARCEQVYGPDRDVEWAIAGGRSICFNAGRSPSLGAETFIYH
jgi:hypothetical protein